MKSLLIYHHLGLGDHIMCHGIIREYAKNYDRIGLFCLPHNFASVAFMFRDLNNVTIIKGDNTFAEKFIAENSSKPENEKYAEIKVIGFENLNRSSGIPLEKQFYAIAGLDVSKKWENFYVERDLAKEKDLFDRIAPKKDYIFLHEDTSRDFNINRNKIDKNLEVFLPDPKFTDNIFDYCTIIERAKEIHVIDSSFMFLIDCLKYTNPEQKLYIHRYSRENHIWKLPILKKNWHIYTLEDYGLGLLKYIRHRLSEFKMAYIIKSQ